MTFDEIPRLPIMPLDRLPILRILGHEHDMETFFMESQNVGKLFEAIASGQTKGSFLVVSLEDENDFIEGFLISIQKTGKLPPGAWELAKQLVDLLNGSMNVMTEDSAA